MGEKTEGAGLLAKIRRAREKDVEIGGFRFTIRRPTDLEMARMISAPDRAERMLRCVVGWSGVRGLDLFPGGDDAPAEFDSDVCVEFLSDDPSLAGPIMDQINEAYAAHAAALEDRLGN